MVRISKKKLVWEISIFEAHKQVLPLPLPPPNTQIGGTTHKEGLKQAIHRIFDNCKWSEHEKKNLKFLFLRCRGWQIACPWPWLHRPKRQPQTRGCGSSYLFVCSYLVCFVILPPALCHPELQTGNAFVDLCSTLLTWWGQPGVPSVWTWDPRDGLEGPYTRKTLFRTHVQIHTQRPQYAKKF